MKPTLILIITLASFGLLAQGQVDKDAKHTFSAVFGYPLKELSNAQDSDLSPLYGLAYSLKRSNNWSISSAISYQSNSGENDNREIAGWLWQLSDSTMLSRSTFSDKQKVRLEIGGTWHPRKCWSIIGKFVAGYAKEKHYIDDKGYQINVSILSDGDTINYWEESPEVAFNFHGQSYTPPIRLVNVINSTPSPHYTELYSTTNKFVYGIKLEIYGHITLSSRFKIDLGYSPEVVGDLLSTGFHWRNYRHFMSTRLSFVI